MNISNSLKGYLFALTATITLSNVYIFSKAALNQCHLIPFGFYWFGFAILWNLLFSYLSGNFKSIKPLSGFQIKNLLGLGLVESIATVSIFIAIDIIPNPAIPSLIRNLEPVLIVILAIFILKERYNLLEIFGVALTILGTVVISYNKNADIDAFFIPGVEFMVIACSFYAIRTIWSKIVIKKLTPLSLNLNKIGALFLVSAVALLVSDQSLAINKTAFINIFIGSILGPFLTSYTQFLSFKYIDASRATLVQSTTGIFTLILAWLYFGKLPFTYQVIGGLITIVGIVLITYKRKKVVSNATIKQ